MLAIPLVLTLALCSQSPDPVSAAELGVLPEAVVRGEGDQVLLMIPCMSGRWLQWEPFMERNQSAYTMHAVTIPGYGGTAVPDLPVAQPDMPWRRNALDALGGYLIESDLMDVVLVGHSWGSSLAVELAARHPDRVRGIVNVEGWLTDSAEEEARSLDQRREGALQVHRVQGPRLADPEAWRRFNWVSMPDRERSQLYHGMFMATDRSALLGYWSEGPYVSLNPLIRSLDIPILNLEALSKSFPDQEAARAARLEELESLGLGSRVQTAFFFRSGHFLMEEHPQALDRTIDAYLSGKTIKDVD